jgi:ribosomal protein L21
VQLGEVLLVGGDQPVLGAPTVAGASVAAEVLQQKRGPKVISFKKTLGNNVGNLAGQTAERSSTSRHCMVSPFSDAIIGGEGH